MNMRTLIRRMALALPIGLLSLGSVPALAQASATPVPTPPPTLALSSQQATALAQIARELPGMNAKEQRANNVWIYRSGLNVAALQCQFSPFLATVPTYNALLRQHSDEMADAFKQITGYFVRSKGQRVGQRAFDTYATRANQRWATFDAQIQFCNAAAMSGRRALYVPKGQFGEFATNELERMRESLDMAGYKHPLQPKLEWASLPTLSKDCLRRGRCG